MQNTALPNGFIAGDARGCGQELSLPSKFCPCHAQPSLERVPPGLPREDSLVCLLTVGGNASMWPPMCSSDRTGWVHMRRPGVKLASAAQSDPALWVMCPVPSCSFSVVAHGKGPTRREEARALTTSSRCWVRTWRHSCYSTSMVFFFFFCVEPGRDEDGRPSWSRIQELPYSASNILLKNPVVCQYVSFQFSSGKFHWWEKYL